MNTNIIEFTPELVASLRKAYDKAVADGEYTFRWEGHELLTKYVKYMLEYLDNEMGEKQ